jgi:energy-converting hydrogenase Eha subunit A
MLRPFLPGLQTDEHRLGSPPLTGENMTTHRTARRLLAAAVIAQPLLIGVNALFHPSTEFTAPGILAAADQDPDRWYVVHLVAALGALLTVPAVLGLRSLVRERGRRVANAGVAAGICAAVLLGIAFGIEASVMRVVATSDIERAAATAVIERFLETPEFFAVPGGVLAFTLAGVLLSIALLAARAVPRWQASLYLAASLATLGGAPGSPIGLLAFAALTAAAVFLARHVADGGRHETGPAENRAAADPLASHL